MYSVVLLVALSAGEGSVGMGHKGYPTPTHHDAAWPGGYHTQHGAGNLWPGYSCWGGCGGYASPAYGVPMTPLINPAPPRLADPDDKKKDRDDDDEDDRKMKGDGKGKKRPSDDDDDDDGKMKSKPKKPADDDQDAQAALITIFLPAGAKLSVDGRPVTASGVKTFVTPPLRKGSAYYYEMKVETTRDGKPFVRTRRLRLTAGESVHADYRDLGERVASKK